MRLTILGSSGSMSGPKSPASSYLLQAQAPDPTTGELRTWSIVFDLGPGSFGALWQYIDPRNLDAVVFSHGHADHVGDLISLYVHHRWHPEGPCNETLIFGPPGMLERACQLDGWAEPEEFTGIFDFITVNPTDTFTVGPFSITTFAGRHTVTSNGYRVVGPGEGDQATSTTFAYTGDTDSCEDMVLMAQGVDLLLSEAAFTQDDPTRGIHLSGTRAGELAAEAGVRRLLLTHIQPWTSPQVIVDEARTVWEGPLDVAEAGEVYSI